MLKPSVGIACRIPSQLLFKTKAVLSNINSDANSISILKTEVMPPEEADVRSRMSSEFADISLLEPIIPLIPLSPPELKKSILSWIQNEPKENESILPFIPRRQFLLFDELVPTYIVLRTPNTERNLDVYISRLTISIEAYATNATQVPANASENGGQPTPATELLYSEPLRESDEPLIISRPSAGPDNALTNYVYVVWMLDVYLGRPRTRYQKPAIFISASATLQPGKPSNTEVLNEEYMSSGVPAAINLLQSFANDPEFREFQPRLPASRITKVSLNPTEANGLQRPIRTNPRRLYRAAPALVWRIRYSKWHCPANQPSILASLDFEITSFATCDVSINDVNLTLSQGLVEPLGSVSFPITCKSGDQFTLLYNLVPDLVPPITPIAPTGPPSLDMRASASAVVSGGSHPAIKVHWRTNVDFSSLLGSPPERPRSQEGASITQSTAAPTSSQSKHSSDVLQFTGERYSVVSERGMSLTISGPEHVYIGESFKWNLSIVNLSEKARKFAILIILRRKKPELKALDGRSSTSSSRPGKGDGENVADTVVDDHVLYARQKNAALEPTELVNLSPDIRIGPLAPAACFTTDIKLLALAAGVLRVEALRIVDISTQEATDIRDLPTIISHEGNWEHPSR